MKSTLFLLNFLLLLSGCKDDKSKASKDTAPVQKIAPNFHEFKVPPPPPPPPVKAPEPEIEPEEEIEAEPIKFPDPKPLMREDAARKLRGLRQHKANQGIIQGRGLVQEPEETYRLQDEDYQEWEDATFEESRSTLPVDRTRILTADMRIPALLEDSVSSQVGGRMIAVVERDVFSPNGKKILLPAYSKIICSYAPLTQNGQTRLPIECKRIIRPDGVSIDLEGAIGADQMGRTGLIGDVDNRTWEKYGAAFLIATTSALAEAGSSYARYRSDKPGPVVIGGGANELSNNLAEVTSQVIEQNIKLAPIITIPPGSRIQIVPAADIVLRHPKETKHPREKQAPKRKPAKSQQQTESQN